jgi:uncharacterized membrane protein
VDQRHLLARERVADAVQDRVRDAFAGQQMTLIHSNLSGEQEARLREVFGETA